ncbi:MAG: Ku protein [Nanoarchaeota archaeon]
MKPIWNGSISFGLVSIPVKLYSAVQTRTVKFRLLHKKDYSPVKYKRYCNEEQKEVPWNEIIKGFEVSKNNFYPISWSELNKLRPDKTNNIEILEFIDSTRIDPIYFNSYYYLAPSKQKDKAFFLFKSVLQTAGKLAIGKFVMKEKEHICTISSYQTGLLLTILNYQSEIRSIHEIEGLKEFPKISQPEMTLAMELINKLYQEEFDISKFKDTFKEQLIELIKQKEHGVSPVMKERKKEANLIKALRKSLQ